MNQDPRRAIGISVIGTGLRMRRVLELLWKQDPAKRLRIVSAFDPEEFSLDALQRQLGCGFDRARDEEQALGHPDADYVFIGLWNCFHARQATRALDAGKNVFCEKPLATSLSDCLAIRDAVRRSGRTFVLGLVLRYSPHYAKIREVLRSGRIGRVISCEFNETLEFNHGGYIFGNWRRRLRNAGSHMLEKCCHDLDLMNWLLESVPVRAASFGGCDFFRPEHRERQRQIGPSAEGLPAYESFPDAGRVDPFGGDADICDNQVAILEYASGVRAAFHTNCQSAIPERRMAFVGTHGALRADVITGALEVRRIGWDDERERIDTQTRDGHGNGDEVMCAALWRTMCEGEPPLASVTEGLCSALAAFGIDQACATGEVADLRPLWQSTGIDPRTVLRDER